MYFDPIVPHFEYSFSLHSCPVPRRPVASDSFMRLTLQQLASYARDGVIVLEDFASPEELANLQSRMVELVRTDALQSLEATFSTVNQTSDDHFMASASRISFFLEEITANTARPPHEMDDSNASTSTSSKDQLLNKCGHALHDLDPVFRAWSRSERMARVLGSLGYVSPIPCQSMYLFKHPRIGAEVRPHQDSSFLITPTPSCTGMWLALEDADETNGCLWAQLGSHRDGSGVHRQFVRQAATGTMTMTAPLPDYDLSTFTALPARAGSLVLLHGAVVHMSYPNTSPRSRHAYSLHVVEGDEELSGGWAAENWLQRTAECPFEVLEVPADARSVGGVPAWRHEGMGLA